MRDRISASQMINHSSVLPSTAPNDSSLLSRVSLTPGPNEHYQKPLASTHTLHPFDLNRYQPAVHLIRFNRRSDIPEVGGGDRWFSFYFCKRTNSCCFCVTLTFCLSFLIYFHLFFHLCPSPRYRKKLKRKVRKMIYAKRANLERHRSDSKGHKSMSKQGGNSFFSISHTHTHSTIDHLRAKLGSLKESVFWQMLLPPTTFSFGL
jgi:hypothetical protein